MSTTAPEQHTGEARVDPWAPVVGQERAVSELRAAAEAPAHAYLLVGPRGSGKRALARAFAAELLQRGKPDPARDVELALAEEHPDLVVVERSGAAIDIKQARSIVQSASRSGVEGKRKVLVLDEFHLIRPDAAATLLKTIEDPPEGTFFVILADEVIPDLVTIASRCVRVDVAPLGVEVIADQLIAEGFERERAQLSADACGGDLERARVLASDDRLELRRRLWWELPDRLDGSGAAAVAAVAEVLGAIEDAMAPLAAQHERELDELDEREREHGVRGSGRTTIVERHKREQRRYRTDEIRFGLSVLARRYRDQLGESSRPAHAIAALDAIQHLARELKRNPNERLQLQALFLQLA